MTPECPACEERWQQYAMLVHARIRLERRIQMLETNGDPGGANALRGTMENLARDVFTARESLDEHVQQHLGAPLPAGARPAVAVTFTASAAGSGAERPASPADNARD
jgi:hypothetical protein